MSTIRNFINEFQFGRLEKPVKDHLKKVYGSISFSLFMCVFGVYIDIYTKFAISSYFMLTSLAIFGMLIFLMSTPSEQFTLRFGFLSGVSFFTGVSLSHLLAYVAIQDPSIIITALLGTSLIFVSFTLAALMAKDSKFLALGGLLMSGMSSLMFLALLNIFFGSLLIFRMELYLGLVLISGFVLYDTQMIIERCRQGDNDFIKHSLHLFLDFVNMFRYIMLILSDKESRSRRRNDSRSE